MHVFSPPKSLEVTYERYGLSNSTAIEANGLVFVGGLTAVDAATGALLEADDIRAHARVTLDLLGDVLAVRGLSLDNVIKVNCFLARPEEDFPGWNEVFLEAFASPYPARTTVGAPLIFGRIEIEMVAAIEPRPVEGAS